MANSVDPDQTAPIGAVCSGSTLFASILNSSVMLGNYLQQTTSADEIFRCIFFLGALRVPSLYEYCYDHTLGAQTNFCLKGLKHHEICNPISLSLSLSLSLSAHLVIDIKQYLMARSHAMRHHCGISYPRLPKRHLP